MSIKEDMQELLDKDVISLEVAEKIQRYYQAKDEQSPNRLVLIFGVLGALLVGLGIILIVAHNWDEMPRRMKAFLSFLPMLLGQAICIYTYFRKMDSATWRESASTFLFFAVGACIALISQIYNIGGDLSSFILTWMLLCLPLVYVFHSSVVSLLYIIGISNYASINSGWTHFSDSFLYYWLLLLGIAYPYYKLIKESPNSNFTSFHHWFIPISILWATQSNLNSMESSTILVYLSLLGLFLALSNLDVLGLQNQKLNSYKTIGLVGTVTILLTLSFDWYWVELKEHFLKTRLFFQSHHLFFIVINSLLAIVILFYHQKNKRIKDIKFYSLIFLLFFPIYWIGHFFSFANVLINILIFILGISLIHDGAERKSLAKLNFGLILIMALISCRFFDTEISFIIRGLLFLIMGIGFFVVNYWMLKKKSI